MLKQKDHFEFRKKMFDLEEKNPWFLHKELEKIDPDCLPSFFGGTCQCPGGCLFSNAGPWKKEENEEIPEDILQARKELTDYMFTGLKTDTEEKIKNNGKEGINPDNL